MRITYLHQYFNVPSMSGGTRSYEMARRLVAFGHEVNLITTYREPCNRRGWFTTDECGVKVHWLPVPYSNHLSYAKRLSAFFRFAISAGRKAASIPTDVIFATSTPLTIALPAIFASRCLRVPMVFEVRDLWPELPIAIGAIRNPIVCKAAQFLEKFAYWSSKEVIALSPGMAEGVAAAGFPCSRITEIPNSSDVDSFFPNPDWRKSFRSSLGIPDDKILLVYVGTFGRINDVGYMPMLAKELLVDPRFYFLMIGDGYDFEKVKSDSMRLGVLNCNLQILSSMPKRDVPRVFAAADISTSLFIPLKAMEANSANKFFDGLSSGCCIAVNYGGWQARLLENSGAGLQLSRDVVVAASQLQGLIASPGGLEQAKKAARQLAVSQFARDKLASRLEMVLSRACKSD